MAGYASIDFDADEYVDAISDSVFVAEFYSRFNDYSFKQELKKYGPLRETMIMEDDLSTAEMYYNQKNYKEMLIYLERALGWKSLEKLKVE